MSVDPADGLTVDHRRSSKDRTQVLVDVKVNALNRVELKLVLEVVCPFRVSGI